MEDAIAAVRSFNRFYTRLVGALDAHFLGSEMSLAEARLLFEIANADRPVASELQAMLGMDAGYVSRMLARFEERGWIAREAGGVDARRRPIAMAPAGRAAFATLDERQRKAVVGMLQRLPSGREADLVGALGAARALLDPTPGPDFSIRPFRTGDMGLIASRQAILYAEEYGWGRGLEVNIGEVTSAFLKGFKPGREQCWLAEIDGALAGSIFLTDEGEGLARLRLFYVEPMARGRGIGRALAQTCVGFAKEAGYRAVTLWTHTVLETARRIYADMGFELVDVAVHDTFGKPEQGETWRLELTP